MPARTVVALVLAVVACKPAAQSGPAEVRLATDLNPAMIDTALQLIARNGGPRAERIAGAKEGATALAREQAAPTPDIRWDSDPYGPLAATEHGELDPAPQAAKDVPPLWRDPGGTWVAIGGRAEVLLVNQDGLHNEHAAPQRLQTLTEPWLKGKVALATPATGMALAHFAALYQAFGEEKMRSWLDALAQNQPQIYDNDAQVRAAVVQGKAVVGLLASDEAAQAAASAARVVVVYPNQRSIGTFVWPTALAVRKGAPEAAQKLAERLADKNIEGLLVARVPGYLPLRGDIPVPPGVRSAANLVVVSVDPARIAIEIGQRKDSLAAWARGASH
ncbi:MAG TPA: extracellular solute-binding protein [Myxococcales bacterium]